MARHLEITTVVGCVNRCSYCPQETLISAYKGKRSMTLEDFKNLLKNVPKHYEIHFSGFSEPFGNRESALMMRHATDQGYEVVVYSTLNGIKDDDIETIRRIPFKHFFRHLIGKDVPHLPIPHDTIGVENPISRAGHLWDNGIARKGATCSRNPEFKQNVVLPDGNVYLCCMDYGLEHPIGNLFETNLDDMVREHRYKLCETCEASIL